MKYHYAIRKENRFVLDSRRREDFDGYKSHGEADKVAREAMKDNRLNETHQIVIIRIAENDIERQMDQAMTTHKAEMDRQRAS